jgi:Protein of unknown function (DUF2924)
MAKSAMNRQPAQTSASIDLDVGLADIAAMNVEQLRELWRQKRGQEPPAAFSKDLIARALAYWLQEEVLGALDARVRKLLGASSRRDGPPAEKPLYGVQWLDVGIDRLHGCVKMRGQAVDLLGIKNRVPLHKRNLGFKLCALLVGAGLGDRG